MKSTSKFHELGRISKEELAEINSKDDNDFSVNNLVYYYADKNTNNVVIDGSEFKTDKGNFEIFGITINELGIYDISIIMKSSLGELAQLPVSIYYDNNLKETVTIRGTKGKYITETRSLGVLIGMNHYIKLYFGATGLEIDKVVITLKEKMKFPL